MNFADYRITFPKSRGMEWNRWLALAGVVLSTSLVSAQQAIRPGITIKSTQRATRNIQSLINGVVIDSDQMPLKYANVRLRDISANVIEQVTTANQLGEFSFVARPGVPYLVEITDRAGRVIAVGDVILTNIGEVAGAVVALPSRAPALAGMFRETATSVISAATIIGLNVVDPALPKVSPTR
jgi:hypothetical protein